MFRSEGPPEVRQIHIALIRIDGIIRQSNRNVRLPGTCRVLTPYIDIPFLAFQVIQCRHAEIYQNRITFHNRSQQGLAPGPTNVPKSTFLSLICPDSGERTNVYPNSNSAWSKSAWLIATEASAVS